MTVFQTHAATPAADEVRFETLRGREWLVAPVVLVREGVLNGGFLGYDEIVESVPGWNGRPVTVPPDDGTEAAANMPSDHRSGHPLVENDDGDPEFVSANQMPFLDDMHFGFIAEAEARENLDGDADMSERGLVGEAWLDVERADDLGGFAVETVRAVVEGEELDVSTGYFHRPLQRQGTHEGERYEAVQTDLMPDHLAMLPNERGACSWADGCGVSHPDAAANELPPAVETVANDADGRHLVAHEDTETSANDADDPVGLLDRARSLLTGENGGDVDTCSSGPCSCGEHNDDDGDSSDPSDPEPNTNAMTDYDIQELADKSAFDAEALREWGEDRLATLAETLDANDDDGDDPDDGTSTDGTDDGAANTDDTSDLLDRIEALESELDSQERDERERLAETVAAHTDHEVDDLVENTDEFPTPALETLAESVDTSGATQGYAGQQGNRVNYVGQGGAQSDVTDDEPDTDAVANVGALATLENGEQAGD